MGKGVKGRRRGKEKGEGLGIGKWLKGRIGKRRRVKGVKKIRVKGGENGKGLGEG